jgi:hypothetical protein
MQATKHLNIHRIKMAILCSFALSCSAIFAQEQSPEKSQRATIEDLNTQIGDYICEHKYDRAAKVFEQVLPLLEKVPYFSEGYLAKSYLNYSSVLSQLHRTNDSHKYAEKARELESTAKRNELEKAKIKPPAMPLFAIQPTPNPLSARGNSPDYLVPPGLSATPGAPTDSEVATYNSGVERRIRRSWFPPADFEGKIAAIKFFVHSSGIVSDIKIDKSAGSVDGDTAMRKSIENAAPFRPTFDCGCQIHFRCTFTGSKQGTSAVHLVRTI